MTSHFFNEFSIFYFIRLGWNGEENGQKEEILIQKRNYFNYRIELDYSPGVFIIRKKKKQTINTKKLTDNWNLSLFYNKAKLILNNQK